MAPSARRPQRAMSPRARTGRVGPARCPPLSLVSTLAVSRWRTASNPVVPSTAALSRMWRSGVSPKWRARAASPAPTSPPTGKSACSLERTGRLRACSRATAWAFIETSSAPLNAPRRVRARPSRTVEGARTGSGRLRQRPGNVTATSARLPMRGRSQPAVGIASRAPAAMPSSASPSGPGPIPRRDCTAGMWGNQLASAAPLAKKTRARAGSPRARVRS